MPFAWHSSCLLYTSKDNLQKAIHTDLAFGLAAGILLTIIGLIMAPKILTWMGTPDDVLKNSVVYFRIYFCGSLAFVMYNIFVGIMQSVGDSRHPLVYLIISSIVNIVLDLLFVGVFHWGDRKSTRLNSSHRL